MKVGFTGTRNGMTVKQQEAFHKFILTLGITEFHHGDCVGADEEAADIVREVFGQRVLHSHPPDNKRLRAYTKAHHTYPELPYMQRNHDIVSDTTVLIGAPNNLHEIMRSGTWATIRWARRYSSHGRKIYLIYRDGNIEEELL